ncbi:MAG: glycerol-3-phosphate 1-O-acyltransferase [Nocardiaceae bacterium]|nr:glycerol-3-phosphate 1-O-acyltransferase [Nocardiaceae bacterium]
MDSMTTHVVLADTTTAVERKLIEQWLAHGGVEGATRKPTLVSLDINDIESKLLFRTDDPLVLPVQVLWLPPERDGVRRSQLRDLVTFTNPRNPNRLAQRWIVKNAPDRHRILTGEPARLSELKARNAKAGGAMDSDSQARFIKRSAVRALLRAERSVIGDRYKVPRLVAEEILDSPTFQKELKRLAVELGMSPAEVNQRAEENLRELVAVQSRLLTDLFTQAMGQIHKRAYHPDVDEAGLRKLQELNRRYPLVFLPSHRSYVDPFVLGEALATHEFPPNHVMGGANLNFWPMGPIARRTGTVFIRRSFGNDMIYRTVMEEYFAYLLSKRFNLEWYMEGGRTRTGKLRPPKYGLLNYVADAVREGRAEDAMIVPVSITYERLNELGAIADEQTGGQKQSEGLAWMARYIRSQQQSTGHVYIRFGAPMSALDRLAAHGDLKARARKGEDVGEITDEADSAAFRMAVQKLAFETAVGINAVTPISANALVTLALLGVNRALTISEVENVIAPVRAYIKQRNIPGGGLEALATRSGLIGVLTRLELAKVVTGYTGGVEAVYTIEPGQHLVAAFYRNNAIHWFVIRAILELAIMRVFEDNTEDAYMGTWEEALRLRDLLKFEFFFADRKTFRAELEAELNLVDPGWTPESLSGPDLRKKLRDTGFMTAHRTLRSFFDAQLVVAERLVATPVDQTIDKPEFMDECVNVGRQMLLQNRIHSTESVSSELFTTALKLADNRGLVAPGANDLHSRRRAFASELREITARLNRVQALDASNLKPLDD